MDLRQIVAFRAHFSLAQRSNQGFTSAPW